MQHAFKSMKQHNHAHSWVDMQAVLQRLWQAAVMAYVGMEDNSKLCAAWRWVQSGQHDWLPSQPAAYETMLLAVTELDKQPLEGIWPLETAEHAKLPIANGLHCLE